MLVIGVIGLLVILFLNREQETDVINNVSTTKHQNPVIMPSVSSGGYAGDPVPFAKDIPSSILSNDLLPGAPPEKPKTGTQPAPAIATPPEVVAALNKVFRPDKGSIDPVIKNDYLKMVN